MTVPPPCAIGVPSSSKYGPVGLRERPTFILYVLLVPWQQKSNETNWKYQPLWYMNAAASSALGGTKRSARRSGEPCPGRSIPEGHCNCNIRIPDQKEPKPR